MTLKTTSTLAAATLFVAIAGAVQAKPATLRCDGVLGNSGEQGAELIRYAPERLRNQRDGLGLVSDRFGTLWDRAGAGRLNRYSLDGRLLRSIALPSREISHLDAVCLVGDTLFLLLRNDLWRLDTASDDLAIKPTELKVAALARSPADGRALVVLAGDPPRLALISPATAETQELPWPPVSNEIPILAVDTEGRPMFIERATRTAYVLVENEWLERGTFPCLGIPHTLDNHYWTFGWHGTITRFNAAFEPVPGVVLGGASGRVIGHLAGNYEINHPTGIASAGPGVYAIGGLGGVAHLAAWNDQTRKLDIVRRIGALHGIEGHLALDARGRIRIPQGVWYRQDACDTPLRFGVGLDGNGQVAVFDNGAFFSSAFVHGTMPAMAWGSFDAEARATAERYTPNLQYPANVRGCVALRAEQYFRTLRLTADLKLIETRHDHNGRPTEDLATGSLVTQPIVKAPTSLASLSDGRVLAAADGVILELTRAEKAGDWTEVRRTSAIGDKSFGAAITITAQGGFLWISDTENHRVLCVDEGMTTVLGVFGGARGDDLAHCDAPTAIASHGRRAVVFDSGNHRLLQLRLE